jgi:hypothetical protein
MTIRNLILLSAAVPALAACGPAEEQPVSSSPEPRNLDVSGMYAVEGETVTVGADERRDIAGTVILVQEGDAFTATFELKTTYPGVEEELPADVIGKGEGKIEGRSFKGTTEQQLVMATVPGIDTGFAFVPRHVGTRIVSDTVGEFSDDGDVSIQIETRPAEGERYRPTRTTLTGSKVEDRLSEAKARAREATE